MASLSPKPLRTMLAPFSASARAIPSPMPLVDPVTIADLANSIGLPRCWKISSGLETGNLRSSHTRIDKTSFSQFCEGELANRRQPLWLQRHDAVTRNRPS
jgi:hypothetical protein